MDRPSPILSESEATPESFHDCHVHGLRWRRDTFSFSMDVQYILEWISPTQDSSGYRFSISEAHLTFKNVDDLKLAMEWSGIALDSQIASLRIGGTRTTPNGELQRYFEIEFSEPEAFISLWSTGYEVALLHEPRLSDVTSIPLVDG
jgi:hypothetical protein